MARKSRYRKSEIKAGVWIFFSLIIFAIFVISVSGSRFWEKLDHYRVRLNYVGGLEVGSPVRMGGVLVGKVVKQEFLSDSDNLVEMTIEVKPGLQLKSNSVAYLSFISITSEQHLEVEPSLKPAPLLAPGDLIQSKELTTMDEVMEHVGFVGDTLQVILRKVNELLKPQNLARIDSIIIGVNGIIRDGSADFAALLGEARNTVANLDTMLNNINTMVAGSDTLVNQALNDLHITLQQVNLTLSGIDSTVENVDWLVQNNAGSLRRMLDNMNRTSENLKELSNTVKENPFLLIRAVARKERKLER